MIEANDQTPKYVNQMENQIIFYVYTIVEMQHSFIFLLYTQRISGWDEENLFNEFFHDETNTKMISSFFFVFKLLNLVYLCSNTYKKVSYQNKIKRIIVIVNTSNENIIVVKLFH